MNNIEEGNKLIAKFMGFELSSGNKTFPSKAWITPLHSPLYEKAMGNKESDLWFHSSWDWLMSVVEKIENISKNNSLLFVVEIGRDWCIIRNNDFNQNVIVVKSTANNKIQSTWEAIVEFINWYNTQTK